jgi:hypothetical protein
VSEGDVQGAGVIAAVVVDVSCLNGEILVPIAVVVANAAYRIAELSSDRGLLSLNPTTPSKLNLAAFKVW